MSQIQSPLTPDALNLLGQLIGQAQAQAERAQEAEGIAAQLWDAEEQRSFAAQESNAQRTFASNESAIQRDFITKQNEISHTQNIELTEMEIAATEKAAALAEQRRREAEQRMVQMEIEKEERVKAAMLEQSRNMLGFNTKLTAMTEEFNQERNELEARLAELELARGSAVDNVRQAIEMQVQKLNETVDKQGQVQNQVNTQAEDIFKNRLTGRIASTPDQTFLQDAADLNETMGLFGKFVDSVNVSGNLITKGLGLPSPASIVGTAAKDIRQGINTETEARGRSAGDLLSGVAEDAAAAATAAWGIEDDPQAAEQVRNITHNLLKMQEARTLGDDTEATRWKDGLDAAIEEARANGISDGVISTAVNLLGRAGESVANIYKDSDPNSPSEFVIDGLTPGESQVFQRALLSVQATPYAEQFKDGGVASTKRAIQMIGAAAGNALIVASSSGNQEQLAQIYTTIMSEAKKANLDSEEVLNGMRDSFEAAAKISSDKKEVERRMRDFNAAMDRIEQMIKIGTAPIAAGQGDAIVDAIDQNILGQLRTGN